MEHSFEYISKIGPVVQDKYLKYISYLELWWPFCSAEQNGCAILVDDIIRNISVKLF